jgi:uracil-DNA glycosylase family 4
MNGADPLKHRLNLWLRSERAMGLPSVPGVELAAFSPQNMSKSRQPAPTPRPADTPAPRQASAPARPPAASCTIPATQGDPTLLPVIDVGFTAPELSPDEKIKALQELDQNFVKGCTRCGLSTTRTQTVFGEGNPDAQICFIGEGPGKDEDASGRPFVGRAGQKLNDMIGAMGLKREDVFICNIVKCRAYLKDIGKDRPPSEEETAACTPYLLRQVEIIRPKVIVTLGLPSTRYLLKLKEPMTKMRGNWSSWRGIKVMPTWHPAYVLRNYTEQTRGEVWNDLKKVLSELGLPIPKRSGKQE